MSGERLREAARVLRERAEAATSGPWGHVVSNRFGPQAAISTSVSSLNISEYANEGEYRGAENAAYIATMHPGVGLPLADWLDEEASRADERQPYFFPLPALAVADAILGGQS